MGDVGEYWKDHKDYERRRDGANKLGMSLHQYDHWSEKCAREESARNRQEKLDRCTIQCECGKWLLDTAAHNSHKMVKGRKGHSVKERKEAKQPIIHDWDIAL